MLHRENPERDSESRNRDVTEGAEKRVRSSRQTSRAIEGARSIARPLDRVRERATPGVTRASAICVRNDIVVAR